MPFVPVPNTVLAEIRMTLDDQQVENTLYFERAGGWTEGTMVDLADELQLWWTNVYSTQCVTAVQLREVQVTDLTSATAGQVAVAPAITALGDLNQEPMPNAVSFTVSFRTALRGRSFRGRNYVVGLGIEQVTGNNVNPAVITSFIANYDNLLLLASSQGCTWVVVSRFSGIDPDTKKPIPRVTGVTTPVTSVTVVDSTVDTQRRRGPGRGR